MANCYLWREDKNMNNFARHNAYIEWKKQANWCDFLRYKIMDIKDKITVQINYINNADDDYFRSNVEYRDKLIGELKDLRYKIKTEERKCKDLKNEYMLRTV